MPATLTLALAIHQVNEYYKIQQHTHRDPLSHSINHFIESINPISFHFGQFLIGQKLVQEDLGAEQLSDRERLFVRDPHHEGQGHEHVGADELQVEVNPNKPYMFPFVS